MLLVIALLVSAGVSVQADLPAIQCLDMQGQPVDWFVFYKMPKLKESPYSSVQNGSGFLYYDSNNLTWQFPQMGMEAHNHAVYYTLKQYYDNKDDPELFAMMYNDEWPGPGDIWSDDLGHSKGVTVFSKAGGIWLIHSVPKFPDNQTYDYPSNAWVYGQSGICISLAYTTLGNLGNQLYYTTPFLYYAAVPDSFAADFPVLPMVASGKFQTNTPYSSYRNFRTLAGQEFTHFAKCGAYNGDLYFGVVAPQIQTSIKVEAWNHGSTNVHSSCTADNRLQVLNAKAIQLPFGINFTTYDDHAKIAIAVATGPVGTTATPWVCIGDMNRQTHQFVRGGGTLCLRSQQNYALWASVISDWYECDDPTPTPSFVKPLPLDKDANGGDYSAWANFKYEVESHQ